MNQLSVGEGIEKEEGYEPFTICEIPPSHAAKLALPPGPRFFIPIIGETLEQFDATEFIKKRVSKYGLIFRSHLFMKPTIVVGDINILKQLMMKEGKLVTTEWISSVQTLLGPGAVTLQNGKAHKAMRKVMLDSTLGKHRIANYYDMMQQQSEKHINSWMDTEGTVVKGYPLSKRCAFGVAYSIVLGFDFTLEETEQVLKTMEGFLGGLFSLPFNIPGTAFHKGLKSRKELDKLAQTQIDKFRAKLDNKEFENNSGKISVIQGLLESDLNLSNQDLLDNAVTFLFASTDTTTGVFTSMLLLIAYSQKKNGLMDQLRDEQKRILEKHPDGKFTKDIIENEIPLLTACYWETMRVIAPVASTFRVAKTDIQIGPNMKIPKGYQILAQQRIANFAGKNAEITNQHIRADWKLDVLDGFNPELWLNKDTKPETMNFGYGVRRCIGYDIVAAEAKIIMSTLLRAGTWELKNGTENIPFKTFPVYVPVDDLDVSFTKNPL